MKASISFNHVKKIGLGLTALFLFSSCTGADKPFSMVNNSDDSLVKNPPTTTTGGGSGTGEEGPPAGTCIVHFVGALQMQISSPGSVGDIIDVQNDPVGFYDVPPISIEVNGSELTMRGSEFPSFLPFIGDADQSYDLVLHGDPKNVATGTYDSVTGKAEIKGFKFLAEVYSNGGAYGTPLSVMDLIPEVTWSTNPGQVAKGSGKYKEIIIDGQAFNPVDKSIIFAVGVTLPDSLGSKDDLANNALGGAALAARFKGTLDQDPASCVEGGGIDPGNGGVPGIGPDEFKFNLNEGGIVGDKVDFSRTEVVTKVDFNQKTILDCSKAENRGGIYKTARIVNTSDQPLTITAFQGADTDTDKSDPGCAGANEFPAFNIQTAIDPDPEKGEVAAECAIDNFQHPVLPCTLPKDGVLRFTLAYQPFNYIKPAKEDDPPIKDTGELQITYNEGKKFNIPLEGYAEPSTKGDFALAKVKQDNTTAVSQVSEGGTMKVSVPMKMDQPFKLRLLNKGTTKWTDLKVSIVYPDDAMDPDKTLTTDGVLSDVTLNPAVNDLPGSVDFTVLFKPLVADGSYDKATIKLEMKKNGADRVLLFPLLGVVGEPVLNQMVDIKLDVTYIGAYIHSPAGAVFSADFRLNKPDLTEIPPEDLSFTFNDIPGSELKTVKYNAHLFQGDDIKYKENEGTSIYSIPPAERQKLVRVFNSRGSTGNAMSGKKGKRLATKDPATFCTEATNVAGAYTPGDCAYFYFKIIQDENSLGLYNPDTGSLILPNIVMEMNNPHHDLIGFSPSGPFPERHIRDTLKLALSTYLVDDVKKSDVDAQGLPKDYQIVTDDRISLSDLNLTGKLTTDTEDPDNGIPLCPKDYFQNLAKDVKNWPTVRCYVKNIEQAQYFSGTPVSYRGVDPNDPKRKIYDVVLAGVTRFSGEDDPNVPFFLKDNGGPLMYIAIHGELIVKTP